MKRFILTIFSITVLFSLRSLGQCTPDPNFSDPGLYPIDSLGTVYRNAPYTEVITINIPSSFSPATIINITVTGITGFPTGISYDCNPSSCVFPGGGSYCIELSGTTSDPIGTYPLTINGTGTVDLGFGGPQTMSLAQLISLSGGALTMPEYEMKVVDTSGSSSQFSVSANISDNNVCPGDNVGLSVDVFNGEAVSYLWSPTTALDNAVSGTPTASPSVTTTYTVTVTDTSGATDDATVTIVVDTTTPTAVFTYTDNNGEVSFDASGSTGQGLTYEWDFGDGSAAGSGETTTHTYASGDTYDVTLTVTNKCGASKDATESADVVITSINSLADAVNYIKVYPNPNSGSFELRVSADEIKSNYNLTILDLQGKVLYQESVSNNSLNFRKSMDLSHLNSGVYFLHINSDGLNYVNRVMIQK